MTREELIKSLRVCTNSGSNGCFGCTLLSNRDCVDRLIQAAADMLEQDGKQEKTADEMGAE